ncbi:MAG TPA: MFS transporter [Roseiflexaceae bacterium]|nr:MFS transporter [Roseiflexaceae bacterium]
MNETPGASARISYLDRLRHLSRPARLYLLHAALLTISLAISSLFFNLAIGALGYPRTFLGLLNTVSIGVAALLSVPLWWLAARVGLRWGLLTNAVLQLICALLFALWPAAAPLLLYSALSGVAAVLFQVSSPPFMMRHSDAESRDHLFTLNAAINIGLAGVGSLIAGGLPALFGRLRGVGAESATAYQTTFLVTAGGLLLSIVPLLLIDEREPRTEDVQTQNLASPQTQNLASPQTQNLASPPATYPSKIQNLKSKLPDFWQQILTRPGPLIRLLIPPLMISFGAALLIPYLNLFFKQRFAIADTTLGAIFAALNVSIGVAALLGPAISARIGKIRTVALTQALSIPFLLALGFAPVFVLVIGAALARAALFNMASPLYDAFAMERTEEAARPTVIGLINGAYSVGYLVAPAISTWTQANYGFGPLFVGTAICYSLAALSNYVFFVRNPEVTR